MFYCYVLQSQKNGRRYVGSCKDLNDRIRRHNARQSKATKHGRIEASSSGLFNLATCRRGDRSTKLSYAPNSGVILYHG